MHIPYTIGTSYGRRRFAVRPLLRCVLTAHEVHLLTLAIEAEADAAAGEGLHHVAESLAWRAAALREAGR